MVVKLACRLLLFRQPLANTQAGNIFLPARGAANPHNADCPAVRFGRGHGYRVVPVTEVQNLTIACPGNLVKRICEISGGVYRVLISRAWSGAEIVRESCACANSSKGFTGHGESTGLDSRSASTAQVESQQLEIRPEIRSLRELRVLRCKR